MPSSCKVALWFNLFVYEMYIKQSPVGGARGATDGRLRSRDCIRQRVVERDLRARWLRPLVG